MTSFPIESLNLQMLNVGLAVHNGDWNWKYVKSPFIRIYLVKDGEAKVHLPDRTIHLTPGHLYLIPAYTVHSYECHGAFIHYYLHVYEGFKSESDIMGSYDFPAEVTADVEDERLFERLCEQYPDAKLPTSNPRSYDNTVQFIDYVYRYRDMPLWQKMELRGAVLLMFSRFMREATPHVWTKNFRLKRVLDYIHAHITETISIEDLANEASFTKSYLIRIFKQDIGISPLQYINDKKTEKAQLLLYTTDMSVKEVAYTLGFSDHSYFIRMFRRMTGITPQEYRMRMHA